MLGGTTAGGGGGATTTTITNERLKSTDDIRSTTTLTTSPSPIRFKLTLPSPDRIIDNKIKYESKTQQIDSTTSP